MGTPTAGHGVHHAEVRSKVRKCLWKNPEAVRHRVSMGDWAGREEEERSRRSGSSEPARMMATVGNVGVREFGHTTTKARGTSGGMGMLGGLTAGG